MFIIYSRTSIAWTPVACLPWLNRLVFESLRNSSDSPNFRHCSYFIIKLYVVCTNKKRLIKAILMSTLNISLLSSKSKQNQNYRHLHPDLASWLTLSGSNYPIWIIFPWSQSWSSQLSSTVILLICLSGNSLSEVPERIKDKYNTKQDKIAHNRSATEERPWNN